MHYEVLRNNKQINPVKIKLPAGKNVPKKDIHDYKKHIQNILNQKITLEESSQNEKIATNEFNNKSSKLN